jgi:APA family basic amino acid/polyamine antiporter
MIVTTLVLEYVLANAAVARSFSAYFAALIGKDPGFFTFPYKDFTVDFMAAGVIIGCCLLLSFSTAGGSWFNIVVTGTQLLVIAIILIAGFVKANPANLTPFLPYGVKGARQQVQTKLQKWRMGLVHALWHRKAGFHTATTQHAKVFL